MSQVVEELFSVEGKTALVTGGAKGIGAMISAALVRAGARVIAISRSAEEGERFSATLALGDFCFLAHGDVLLEQIEVTEEILRIAARLRHAAVVRFDRGVVDAEDLVNEVHSSRASLTRHAPRRRPCT